MHVLWIICGQDSQNLPTCGLKNIVRACRLALPVSCRQERRIVTSTRLQVRLMGRGNARRRATAGKIVPANVATIGISTVAGYPSAREGSLAQPWQGIDGVCLQARGPENTFLASGFGSQTVHFASTRPAFDIRQSLSKITLICGTSLRAAARRIPIVPRATMLSVIGGRACRKPRRPSRAQSVS